MFRYSRIIAAISLFACALPLAAFAGDDSVDRKVAADANGEVVISNVSGTIDVRGWDRNEVQVTGHLGEDVERLDVETSGGRTVVKVVLPRGNSHDGDAEIEVSVPRGSSVEVSAVSADVSSRGVLGTQRLKSVSGEITADIAGDESEVRSVSGDVTVRGSGKPTAPARVLGERQPRSDQRGRHARRGHGQRRCARADGRDQRRARPHHLRQLSKCAANSRATDASTSKA